MVTKARRRLRWSERWQRGEMERVVGVFVCSLRPPTEHIRIITSAVMVVMRLIWVEVFTLCFHLLVSATVRWRLCCKADFKNFYSLVDYLVWTRHYHSYCSRLERLKNKDLVGGATVNTDLWRNWTQNLFAVWRHCSALGLASIKDNPLTYCLLYKVLNRTAVNRVRRNVAFSFSFFKIPAYLSKLRSLSGWTEGILWKSSKSSWLIGQLLSACKSVSVPVPRH